MNYDVIKSQAISVIEEMIKKYNIEVYSGSLNDGYKRPKLIKKY